MRRTLISFLFLVVLSACSSSGNGGGGNNAFVNPAAPVWKDGWTLDIFNDEVADCAKKNTNTYCNCIFPKFATTFTFTEFLNIAPNSPDETTQLKIMKDCGSK